MTQDKKIVKTPTKKKQEAIKHCKTHYNKNTKSYLSKSLAEKYVTKGQSPIIKVGLMT